MPQDDLIHAFRQTVLTLSEHYLVPDIVLPESLVIFVLESPHVQELKYGAPVSGPSGATMTKHLFGDSYARHALGRLVKKNADEGVHRPRLDRIGLMNVSNVPLQAAAYGSREVMQTHGDWLRAMGTLRSANQQDEYRDPRVQTVQAVLAGHLRRKLQLLTDRSCVFVPCGRFAQKFFRLANVESPAWSVIDGVPHPSYNSWDRSQYQTAVNRVREALGGAASEELAAAGAGVVLGADVAGVVPEADAVGVVADGANGGETSGDEESEGIKLKGTESTAERSGGTDLDD